MNVSQLVSLLVGYPKSDTILLNGARFDGIGASAAKNTLEFRTFGFPATLPGPTQMSVRQLKIMLDALPESAIVKLNGADAALPVVDRKANTINLVTLAQLEALKKEAGSYE
jgi:hypothetical protein